MIDGDASVVVDADSVVVVADEAEVEDSSRKPLQKPLEQVLKAHCELSLQTALKFPQARIVSAVVP